MKWMNKIVRFGNQIQPQIGAWVHFPLALWQAIRNRGQLKLIRFGASSRIVIPGEPVELQWELENALIIHIEGIGYRKPQGAKVMQLKRTSLHVTCYHLQGKSKIRVPVQILNKQVRLQERKIQVVQPDISLKDKPLRIHKFPLFPAAHIRKVNETEIIVRTPVLQIIDDPSFPKH